MIEIGSKWVHIKTGNRYEVVQIMDCAIHEENLHYDGSEVWYKDQKGEIYVRTEKHFLDSFKPYEPVKQEFIVTKLSSDIWEGWLIFHDQFAKLKKPMMYKITVEEIFKKEAK